MRSKRKNTTLLAITFLLSISILLSILKDAVIIVNAKEIEATHEWQVIEEGDSIPAGLHVRMDLETGIKWAKLLDEDDPHAKNPTSTESTIGTTSTAAATDTATDSRHKAEEKQDSNNALSAVSTIKTEDTTNEKDVDDNKKDSDVKITRLTHTKVDPEKSAKITSQLLKQAQNEQQRQANMKESIATLNDFDGDMSQNEMDYETMYRTLLSLPEEDRLRLNVPPSHPYDKKRGDDTTVKDEKELDEFITQIKDIWSQRQADLKKVEEEYLANTPDIIRDRISFLKEYVTSPLNHLKNIIGDDHAIDGSNSNDDGQKQSMNIIEVLEDLEYQLMDIDMARDFYTMGGWPILVSLLTDSIHGLDVAIEEIVTAQNWTSAIAGTGTNQELKLPEDQQRYLQRLRDAIWNIQSLANWSIGTAVKNVDEFQSWAFEDLSDLLKHRKPSSDIESGGVNVISVLLSKLTLGDSKVIDPRLVESKAWLKLKQKELYALGALLRGNKEAIYYFDRINGPATLSTFFHAILASNANEKNSIMNDNAGMKLLSRVMILGVDLITEVLPLESNLEDLETKTKGMLPNLTNEHWCSMPVHILSNPAIHVQRQALEAMVPMAPHCDFDRKEIEKIQINDDAEIQSLLKTVMQK